MQVSLLLFDSLFTLVVFDGSYSYGNEQLLVSGRCFWFGASNTSATAARNTAGTDKPWTIQAENLNLTAGCIAVLDNLEFLDHQRQEEVVEPQL